MTSITTVSEKLGQYKPEKHLGKRFLQRSAVALLLREDQRGVSVLMIKRSEREGDPWSGQMGFPGGREEEEDENSLATVQRETLEEIGLDIKLHAPRLGRLSDITARPRLKGRLPLIISPHVFLLENEIEFNLNHEVQEIVWVPLGFFMDRGNRQRMEWRMPDGVSLDLPCYFYRNERIWGLSLQMLDELLDIIRD
jgi:8-oxo-dGTP pyrophosphatase MutT (NUDIX family)